MLRIKFNSLYLGSKTDLSVRSIRKSNIARESGEEISFESPRLEISSLNLLSSEFS